MTSTSPVQAGYTIFIDSDGKIKARNTVTGIIDYQSADGAAVLQRAIDALSSTGGAIILRSGTYVWESVPALPKDLPTWLKIVGETGVAIRLTAKGPRAFDFRKTADYDTFRYIWLEGFTVDCNNVGGKHHVVLGTYVNDEYQTRINIHNIIIRNIVTKHVPVDPTLTSHRRNICLVVAHPSVGEAQTVIRDILIDNCDLQGGNAGIEIAGNGPSAVGLNIFVDQVYIHNCKHSMLSVQTSFFLSTNFHVGNRAFGGYAHIAECYGEYSGDDGIEVNNINALVEGCVIRDAFLTGYYHCNYNNLLLPKEQSVTFRNCEARRISIANTANARGWAIDSNLKVPVALGSVSLDNCTYHGEGGQTVTGMAMRVAPASGMERIDVKNFKANVPSVSIASGENYLRVIQIMPSGGTLRPKVSLQNIDVVIAGSKSGGTVQLMPIYLSKVMDLEINNLTLDVDVTGVSAGEVAGIEVGADAGSSIAGVIRGYKIKRITTDTSPRGIDICGTGSLMIPTEIRIEDCDFTAMVTGTNIRFFSPSNADRVIAR
ncbi:hypothetical protein MUP05_08405 [Candidatus Bathyarchaeota archaeon]|nr:hypothetical protein [Candidatus Bathyarchaeota archaeon]